MYQANVASGIKQVVLYKDRVYALDNNGCLFWSEKGNFKAWQGTQEEHDKLSIRQRVIGAGSFIGRDYNLNKDKPFTELRVTGDTLEVLTEEETYNIEESERNGSVLTCRLHSGAKPWVDKRTPEQKQSEEEQNQWFNDNVKPCAICGFTPCADTDDEGYANIWCATRGCPMHEIIKYEGKYEWQHSDNGLKDAVFKWNEHQEQKSR